MSMRQSDDATQLPLDFPHDPSMGRDDFIISDANRAALTKIETWPHWPARVFLLIGPNGSGKTHLSTIFCELSDASLIDARHLTAMDPMTIFDHGPIVFENIDHYQIDEKTLFHILNLVREQQSWLILTCRQGPEYWDLKLPDLISRLRAADRIEILPPDDDLLRAVIVKQFADRQIVIDRAMLDYMLVRIERSLEFINQLIFEVDKEMWSSGRRLTKPLAASLIDKVLATHEISKEKD